MTFGSSVAPRFSVAVPVFNHERFVGETVASAFGQDYEGLEVLISDNASTDRSREVAVAASGGRAIVASNATNIGFAANLDRAVALGTAPFVMLVSSDDRMQPNALSTYARLLDLGRELVEERVPRSLPERTFRRLLRFALVDRDRFALLARLGRPFRALLPERLRGGLPAHAPAASPPPAKITAPRRTVLLLQGCVQPTLRPEIDSAATRLLARLGVATRSVPQAGCCGAIDHHMAAPADALSRIRRNVDAWYPELEAGADALLVTASGCGAMVKEYGHLLRDDPAYAERAARVAAAARDPAELFGELDLAPLGRPGEGRRIAFHAPCTLQHGQKLPGITEALLTGLGFELTPVADAHLCCGSAGTYSVLQPELSQQLRTHKLANLETHGPELIASANIGCLHHLEAGTSTRVVHWLELVAERLSA